MQAAIIGAGLMGRWHAITARKLGADIVAVADTDEAAAGRLAARFPNARACTTIDTLFSVQVPDVVHICTPLPTHNSLCLTAIEQGAHVVCEKPLAESANEVRNLHARAAAAGKLICPVHQFAAQAGVRQAKRLLDELGTISRVAFVICSAGAEGMNPAGVDGVVADILPHPFSVLSVLWPGVAIENLDWHQLRPGPGEVLAHSLADGIPVSLAISMSGRPTRCYMEIQGSQASLWIDFFHGFCVRLPGRVSRLRKMVYPLSDSIRLFSTAAVNLARRTWRREPAYPGLEQLLGEFYRAVELGGDEPIPAERSIAQAVARDRFLQAFAGKH